MVEERNLQEILTVMRISPVCPVKHITEQFMTDFVLVPRLGLLVAFLPPRILKKPFPKDERAFLEPKLSSSMEAGKVAEGFKGGLSLILPFSSFVHWENKNVLIVHKIYNFLRLITLPLLTFSFLLSSKCAWWSVLVISWLLKLQNIPVTVQSSLSCKMYTTLK